MDSRSSSRSRFDEDCCAVAKNFRHALHDFSRIVAQTDDRVRAERPRVLQHPIERIAPRLFAEVGEDRNVSADERLQSRADGSKNRARSDDYSSHHSERFDGAVAVERKSGGCHGWVHDLSIGSVAAEFQPPVRYGAGDDWLFAGVVFAGDLRSLFFPNRSPMSKKLM